MPVCKLGLELGGFAGDDGKSGMGRSEASLRKYSGKPTSPPPSWAAEGSRTVSGPFYKLLGLTHQ